MKRSRRLFPRKLTVLLAAGLATTCLNLGNAINAQADSPPPSDEQEKQAREAFLVWQNNAENQKQEAPQSNGESSEISQRRTTDLYRGSFLMWSRERVDFGFNSQDVTWSDGYQQGGAIFPHTMEMKGTERILEERTQHIWRGSYVAGAGVPTPWGNANAYTVTATAETEVHGSGAWNASWTD